jgi:hypothetical protein
MDYGLPVKRLIRLNSMQKWLTRFDDLLTALFDPEIERRFPWLSWGGLSALYLGGLWMWGKFLNWGRIPFDFHDWAEVNAPRLAFVRDAVIKGVLPLHMPDSSALRGVTDRFMSIPDVVLSPQVLLMRFMDVGTFVLVDTLFLYTLGVLGLLWLRKHFKLGLLPYAALFFLFNFNGHILTHYSIGHITWAGYFLFPWAIVLIFQLLEGDRSWSWSARMALLMFFMYLQGSFHQFIWMLLFLGLLALAAWKKTFLPILRSGIFTVLLSMVRILPPVLLLNQFDDEFLGGYPTLMDVLSSFVVVKFPEQSLQVRSMFSNLGWWEYSVYIGVAGAAFLAYFGIYRWIRRKDSALHYAELLLPVFGVFLLSIGRIYRIVRFIPVPLFSGERASIRMIILPVVILLVIAAVELQIWLRERKLMVVERLVGVGLLVIIIHDLWQHLKAWQVINAFPAFPNTPVNLAIKVVANHADPPYITSLAVGGAISFISLFVLLFLVWRERRQRARS